MSRAVALAVVTTPGPVATAVATRTSEVRPASLEPPTTARRPNGET